MPLTKLRVRGLLIVFAITLLLLSSCSGSAPLTTDPKSLRGQTPVQDQELPNSTDTTAYPQPPPAQQVEAAPAFTATSPIESLPTTADGWTELATDVSYREFTNVPGTQHPVHVARMKLEHDQNPDLTLDTLKGGGYLVPWEMEGLQNQVQRYNDSLNYWGDLGTGGKPFWGKRSRILVAINGSLVDTIESKDENKIAVTLPGLPNQGMVQSGWYMDRFQDFQNRSGFVWTMDKNAFIGGCVTHPASSQTVLLNLNNPDSELKISGINVPRTADRGVFIYTPQYGLTTRQELKPNNLNVEVVVQMVEPLLIVPQNAENPITGKYVLGDIIEVRVDQEPTPIEFNQVVISAYGDNGSKLLSYVQGREGTRVAFNLEVKDGLVGDCQKSSGNSWNEAYAALGVDVNLVEDGEALIPVSDGIAPRTAIGINQEFVFFIAAEGRPGSVTAEQQIRSGISLWDLSNFLVNELNVDQAANLDGGGSTTMVIYDQVVTEPGDFLPMICPQVFAPGVQQAHQNNSSQNQAYPGPGEPVFIPESEVVFGQTSAYGDCQRTVINGIAMISVEPMIRSNQRLVGQQHLTSHSAALRQGPGVNYDSFAILPPLSEIKIIDSGTNLNGIYASGTYWWYIEAGKWKGWMDERQISIP